MKEMHEELYLGKKITIINMDGELRYNGKEGTVTRVDDAGQLWGTWGGLAIIPGVDDFQVID